MPLPIDPICLSCGVSNPPNASVCRVCGASLEVQEFLPAKTRVGHFVIESVLGRGGFGITYKATDVSNGTTVALKELMPEGMAARGTNGAVNIKASQVAEFEEIKTKFIAEAQLLRKITDAATAKFVDLVAQNQTLYMAMDFVEGVTLESRIASGSLLSVKETRSILRDVLGVLEEMHLLNILHRDIKPANIILQPGGAKLIDFGSGLRFQKNKTIRVTSRVLTPAYAPLELYGQNIRLSPAADLYSLAATIYEAMTGVRIPSALERANGAKVQTLSKIKPRISRAFANAIDKSLAVRVDARPQTVKEFRELLDASREKAKNAQIHTTHNTVVNQIPTTSIPSRIGLQNVASTVQGQTTITGWLNNENTILIVPLFEILLLMIFSLLVLPFDSNRAQIIFFALFTAICIYVVSIPIAWALVQPIRWLFDWFSDWAASKNLPLSFYRQSMLGLYGFGIAALFIAPIRNKSGTFDFEKIFPLLFLGGFLVAIGLVVSHANNQVLVRPLKFPTFLGLHLLIPALIVGAFVSPFTSPIKSAKPAPSSQTITSSAIASSVQPPAITSSAMVALADVKISGNKQVCKEHSSNPLVRFMFKGTFLIPLDDESFAVSNAIASRLKATALPCWDATNTIRKFTYSNNGLSTTRDRPVKIIWDITDLEYQFVFYSKWFNGDVVLLTAKPIVGSGVFLEQISYQPYKYRQYERNFLLVSTAALKPANYKTSPENKRKFLERVVTVIKLQQTQDKPQIKNLEDLDKLWRK